MNKKKKKRKEGKKICIKCDQEKLKRFFSKRDGRHGNLCKKCDTARKKITTKKRKKKRQQFLFDYLLDKSCVDCGEENILVLEFDHREGTEKVDDISGMVGSGRPEKEIIEEINKCDILCSNCHQVKSLMRSCAWRYKLAKEKGLV